jgi:HK97 family phage major capsid protein
MNKLEKLRQALAAETSKMVALDALADKEGRDLTAEEKVQLDASIATIATLKGDITRQEAIREAERTAPAIAIAGVVVGKNNAEDQPWASLAEQMSAIRTASTKPSATDVRLLAASGATEAVDADGAFLIAPEFSSEIIRRTFATGQVAKRCKTMPMASNRLIIPGANDASRLDGQRNGGVTSFWTYEAALYTKSKPTFRQIALQIDKLTVLTYGTDELLADGDAWQTFVNSVVPDEFDFKLTDAIFNGPGTGGGPLGISLSGALLAIARANNGAAPTSQDLFNMYQRIPAYVRGDAAFFINQDMESSLWNLTRGSGTAVELLYTPNGMRGNTSGYGVLFGLPVIPIEQAATTGTQGDITLASFSQYMLGRRGGIKADTSIHVQFLTGEQAFRWQMRVAGETLWDKPVTPKNGTNTYSPFVQLTAA